MRKMKDSGIEWIGQIPQEWKTIRLRSRFSFGKGLPITKADLAESGIGVVSYGQIHSKANIGTTIKPELIRYVDNKYLTTNESSLVSNGDFIFADTSEDISGCGNCMYVDVDYPMFAGYHTMILRPVNELSTKYYSYLFATDAWRSQIRAQASGVKLFSITQKMLRDALLVEPSEEEKDRIVRYLDDKCAAIDELIAAKEKTNALLKERRQSIIYEAVTKGLNPDALMKDSGIEWIGQIPEHWTVGKTIYGLEMPITDGPHETPQLYSEGVPFVSAEAVSCGNGKIDFDHIRGYISEEYYDECCKKYIPQINDIYMIKSGATTGKVAIVDTERKFTIWSPLAVFRCLENKCHYKYLFYFLQSDAYQKQVESKWSFGTQQNIGMRTLERLMVCFPTVDEQKCIADYLDDCCSETDKMILANDATIQKLKEYRQSIIYEAVTGKIEI